MLVSTVEEVVEAYCKERAISPVFPISERYDLRDFAIKDYPTPTQRGCYIFFTEPGDVLYVGETGSKDGFGSRWCRHFGQRVRPNFVQPNFVRPETKKPWSSPPRFLVSIAMPDPHEDAERRALERYLIQALNPPENRR